jgi:hypothetical protein
MSTTAVDPPCEPGCDLIPPDLEPFKKYRCEPLRRLSALFSEDLLPDLS